MIEPLADQRQTDPGFDLASTLLHAWLLGDTPLRMDLDRAIRSYARRNPDFQADLRRALDQREAARHWVSAPPTAPQD